LINIDLSKINSLAEKCLVWMKGERHSSIRVCGFSFLRIIVSGQLSKLGKGFVHNYILNPQGCIYLIDQLLKEEVDAFQLHVDL